jgi:hypothetical protein
MSLLIARVTGMILGYAVPDGYCDRRLVLDVFNRAHEKLSESVSNYCGKRRSQSDLHSDVMSIETFMQQLRALNSSLETWPRLALSCGYDVTDSQAMLGCVHSCRTWCTESIRPSWTELTLARRRLRWD